VFKQCSPEQGAHAETSRWGKPHHQKRWQRAPSVFTRVSACHTNTRRARATSLASCLPSARLCLWWSSLFGGNAFGLGTSPWRCSLGACCPPCGLVLCNCKRVATRSRGAGRLFAHYLTLGRLQGQGVLLWGSGSATSFSTASGELCGDKMWRSCPICKTP
jgi:hypothetical protein